MFHIENIARAALIYNPLPRLSFLIDWHNIVPPYLRYLSVITHLIYDA